MLCKLVLHSGTCTAVVANKLHHTLPEGFMAATVQIQRIPGSASAIGTIG